MRIINRNSLNKKVLIILGSVLVVASIGIGVFYFKSNSENHRLTEEIDNTSSVQEDQVPPENNNSNTNTSLPDKNNPQGTFEPNPNTPTPGSAPEKPNVLRAETTGTAVKVVATFQNISSGYCELIMTNGNSNISHNAQIVVGPNYYSCSFSIPLTGLPAGSWTTTVNHKIGTATTSSDPRIVEVN